MTTVEAKYPTYRILGRSGIRVFPICLGCMQFGETWKGLFGCGSKEEESEKVLETYIKAGGNFLDTAVNYQLGESEKMIGRLMKKMNIDRESLVIATKFTSNPHGNSDPNMAGNQSKNMFYSLEQSLKRLQTHYVDVLYVHFFGFGTCKKVLMRQLDDIVRSGKVRAIAMSDTSAWRVAMMQSMADQHGWHPFCAYQGKYSLIERDIEQEIVPMCQDTDIALVPWGVVGRGALAGVRSNEELVRTAFVPKIDGKIRKVQELLVGIGKEHDKSAASVAMNWAVNQPGITSILVGPRNVEQMKDSLTCLDFELTKEQMGELNGISKDLTPLLFPHDLIGMSLETCGSYSFPTKAYNLQKKR